MRRFMKPSVRGHLAWACRATSHAPPLRSLVSLVRHQQLCLPSQNEEEKKTQRLRGANNILQIQHFHVTRQTEIWPIILGAGVAYMGLKFFHNYYEAKEKGTLKPVKEKKEKKKKKTGPSIEELWGSAEFGKVTGIMGLDTGTMYSRVAVSFEEGAKVVENAEGSRGTPSIVGMQGEEFMVGTQAKTLPHLYAPQELIGRRVDDPGVVAFVEDMGYAPFVNKGIGGTMQLVVGDSGIKTSPELLTAKLIAHMGGIASANVESGACSHAFLALPLEAAVSPKVHRAMQVAAEQANLTLLGAAPAPLCSVLGAIVEAGGMDEIGMELPATVVICDVGRSTDITVLRVVDASDDHGLNGLGRLPHAEDDIDIIHSTSAPFVGGRKFDQSVIDWLCNEFKKANNLDLTVDGMTMQRVEAAALAARIELSNKLQSEINEPFITADATGPKHLIASLSRSQLDRLCRGNVDQVTLACKNAMRDALESMPAEDLANAYVAVIGGMARMPALAAAVHETLASNGVTNPTPIELSQPEEVTAIGAGIKGAIRAKGAAGEDQ